jgi:hypothetical protein
MKKIPKWFKFESVVIVILLIVTFIIQSTITVAPGHEYGFFSFFIIIYCLLIMIWVTSLIFHWINR